MNKKGATVDNIWVAITFFGLALFFIVVMLFWSGIQPLNAELWGASSVGMEIKNNTQNAIDTFDFILVTVYIGLHLGILVTVFLLRTHPVIYVFAILLIAILALVAAPLSNAYEDIIQENEINAVSGDIPMSNFILNNLPKFEVIWGFITAIIMFGLARYEGII